MQARQASPCTRPGGRVHRIERLAPSFRPLRTAAGQVRGESSRILPARMTMGCRSVRSGARPDIPLDVGSRTDSRAQARRAHGACSRRRGQGPESRSSLPHRVDALLDGAQRRWSRIPRLPEPGSRRADADTPLLTETKRRGDDRSADRNACHPASVGRAAARRDAPCTNAWGMRRCVTLLRRCRGRCGRTSSCSRASCRCLGRCRAASSPSTPERCSRGGCCRRDGSVLRTARGGNRW